MPSSAALTISSGALRKRPCRGGGSSAAREQAQQRRRFLRHVGLGAEVVARQLGERELAFGREFPRQVEVDLARDLLGRASSASGSGAAKRSRTLAP
jgi:hypothetical protein